MGYWRLAEAGFPQDRLQLLVVVVLCQKESDSRVRCWMKLGGEASQSVDWNNAKVTQPASRHWSRQIPSGYASRWLCTYGTLKDLFCMNMFCFLRFHAGIRQNTIYKLVWVTVCEFLKYLKHRPSFVITFTIQISLWDQSVLLSMYVTNVKVKLSPVFN